MRKPGLSPTRQRIIEYIHDFYNEKGYTPTVRDIMRGCNLSSTAVVQHHLKVLESEHQIERDSKVFRSIQLPDKKSSKRIPVLGKIAAGVPIPVPNSEAWHSEAVDSLELGSDLIKGQNIYALKVSGHSMIDALIDDGDLVLLQSTRSAENGDMVAAWLKNEQEITLKKFYKEGDRIRLQPANALMQPIYVEPENLEIQGKVVAVFRKLG